MRYKELLFFHMNTYWLNTLFNTESSGDFERMLNKLKNQIFRKVDWSIADSDEGYIIGKLLLEDTLKQREANNIQERLGFLEKKYPGYSQYLIDRSYAWGVPLSYKISQNSSKIPLCEIVNKHMNLFGSTKSHGLYFDELIKIVKSRLVTQSVGRPQAIVDIGCGDGSLLRQLKKELCELKIKYIGVDVDERSLKIARSNDTDGIHFIQGDVSDPDILNDKFLKEGLPPLDECFHVRAFVDHNFTPIQLLNGNSISSKDEYFYCLGDKLIGLDSVETSYFFHFSKWKKYIKNFGLAVIELHNIKDACIYSTPSIAYEIFHLLSGQYIIEYENFNLLTYRAGWEKQNAIVLPNIDQANISISFYK